MPYVTDEVDDSYSVKEMIFAARTAKLSKLVGAASATEIADLKQQKRNTRPSAQSGPDALAKHAEALTPLG